MKMFLRCISIAVIIFSMITAILSLGGLFVVSKEIRVNYVSPKIMEQHKLTGLFPNKTKCIYEWKIFKIYICITIASYICTFIGIFLYKEASIIFV